MQDAGRLREEAANFNGEGSTQLTEISEKHNTEGAATMAQIMEQQRRVDAANVELTSLSRTQKGDAKVLAKTVSQATGR